MDSPLSSQSGTQSSPGPTPPSNSSRMDSPPTPRPQLIVDDLPRTAAGYLKSRAGPTPWRVVIQVGTHILPITHMNLVTPALAHPESPSKADSGGEKPVESTAMPNDQGSAAGPHPGQPARRRVWALVYYNDISPFWWILTVSILLLDEALRSGTATDAAKVTDLLEALRFLRDFLVTKEEQGCSAVPIPLFDLPGDIDLQVPGSLSLGRRWDLQVTHELAYNLLQRRYRHALAARFIGWLSGDQIGFLVREAVKICTRTGMSLTDEDEEKLTIVSDYVCALLDDDLLHKSFERPTKETEILAGIVGIGCQLEISYNITSDLSSEVPIARGGFGEVYKVETHLWGTLAVKRARQNSGAEENAKGEFRLVTELTPHLNIMPMFGSTRKYDEDGGTTLVMPWAEKGSLEGYLQKNPEINRRRLLQQVASALAHIHNEHMVHGDIHMKNILISGEGRALLCDFGLAKRRRDTPSGDIEYATIPEGVPVYIAPERHAGAPRSPASDVFAFGMLCLQTYSGVRPLSMCPNDMAIILALDKGERPSRDEVSRPDFTDEMWQLVQRCWAQDPTERPSMEEVYQSLCEMDTPEERQLDEDSTVTMTLRFFHESDKDLTQHTHDQELARIMRSSMRFVELCGLKRYIDNCLGPKDPTLLSFMLYDPKTAPFRRHFLKSLDPPPNAAAKRTTQHQAHDS